MSDDIPPSQPQPIELRCRSGHILGIVTNGRLLIYSQALTETETKVSARILGEADGAILIHCTICGVKRRWSRKRRQKH